MARKIVTWLAWRRLKKTAKKLAKENPEMLDTILSFLTNMKSRLGGFGAFLGALGLWLQGWADADVITFSFVFAQVKALGLLLAGYGIWDKLVREDGFLSKLLAKLKD